MSRTIRYFYLLLLTAIIAALLPCGGYARPRSAPTPTPVTAVINLNVISARRAIAVLRTFFPKARMDIDAHANAIVILAPPDDIQQMRNIVQGIDVRDPQRAITDVVDLRVLKPTDLSGRLRALFPDVRVEASGAHTLILRGTNADVTEVKTLIASLDVAPNTPAPTARPEDTVRVTQVNPKTAARTLVREVPGLQANVSGSTIILAGSEDAIQKAKTLAQSIDVPTFGAKYTQVYRLRSVDAASVGDLISRSFPAVKVTVDESINTISVYGTAAEQQRIATAIDQVDALQSNGTANGPPAYGNGNIDVVQLNSAIPGQNGAPSTTASDIAQAVQQSLGSLAPDLRLTPLADKAEIVLAGNTQSIRLAHELIERLDVPQPLVALDTEVLEIDENVARNLGLEVPGAYISTTYNEIQPTPNPFTGQPGKIGGFQPFTRTPITFQAELNFLIQKGEGRVLADPRVTTVSGRSANITAGDTINVLTQTGGGITPITQQLQSFPTGVTLDITPIVNKDGTVTVSVHPRVSSVVAGSAANAVPDIAQREATTVVKLRDNETLVIGGLIQESSSKQVTKIPLLGDLPLIGRLFQDYNVSNIRNELIIAITPHVLQPGQTQPPPSATLPIPTAEPLPTLPPNTTINNRIPAPHPEPSPVAVGTPLLYTPSPTLTPVPAPTPSAFAQTNVFTYGSPPPNTFAADNAAAQVFFVQFSPTVLTDGTTAHVFVVTSSNVKRVTFGYPGREVNLSQAGGSKWQADFNFSTFGVPTNTSVNLVVSAYATIGSAATVQVPVNVTR